MCRAKLGRLLKKKVKQKKITITDFCISIKVVNGCLAAVAEIMLLARKKSGLLCVIYVASVLLGLFIYFFIFLFAFFFSPHVFGVNLSLTCVFLFPFFTHRMEWWCWVRRTATRRSMSPPYCTNPSDQRLLPRPPAPPPLSCLQSRPSMCTRALGAR